MVDHRMRRGWQLQDPVKAIGLDFAMMLAGIAAIWAAAFLYLADTGQRQIAAAEREAENLARVAAASIDRSVAQVDAALLGLRASHARGVAFGGDANSLPGVAMLAAGSDGRVTWTSRSLGEAGDDEFDLSDRAVFRHFADTREDDLFVGHPAPDRVSRRWVVPIARRLTAPRVAFEGITAAFVDPQRLADGLRTLDLGPGATLMLMREDGAVLARVGGPAAATLLGDRVDSAALFEQAAARNGDGGAAAARIGAVRRLSEAPLLVSISLERDAVMAPWRRERAGVLLAALALSVAAGLILRRLWRLRWAGAIERRTMAATMASLDAGILVLDRAGWVMAMNGRAAAALHVPPHLRRRAPGSEIAHWLSERLRLTLTQSGVERRCEPDGSVVEIRSHALPDGMHVLTYTDVTRWDRAEQAAAAAREAAEAALMARADLGRLLGREIRTPLNAILGGLDLLLETRLDPAQARIAETIQYGADGLRHLLDAVIAPVTGEPDPTGLVPFGNGAAAVPSATPATPLPAGRSMTVLVVDDNRVNRVVATHMLERLGHTVRQAESGASAVDIVRRGGCDLVLMDVMMPGMDGLLAARGIRALPGIAGACPVVGLTANTAPDDQAACRLAGMDGFLGKPVTRHKLAAAVALAGRLSPTRARSLEPAPHAAGAATAPVMPHSSAMNPVALVSTAVAD